MHTVPKNPEFCLCFLTNNKRLVSILTALISHNARPYVVGGAVRDLFLGDTVQDQDQDIDIEVHELMPEMLEKVLSSFGEVITVGKQFGVLRLKGLDVDWSLPRTDSCGRKPVVTIDPFLGIEKALARRDVTMNAMALDLHTLRSGASFFDCLVDPYGGVRDISNKQLRAVDQSRFGEDPLRFYRVMHFIGRFEMTPDEKLNELCRGVELTEVARERIYEELKKLFLKSRRPSLGIRWLATSGRLRECMPEVAALQGVHQHARHHPEGDVFEHSMQALDAAVNIGFYENEQEQFFLMMGALCHDFGKVTTTDVDGHAYGHDSAGVEPTTTFLKRFAFSKEFISKVCTLVRYHLSPGALVRQKSSLRAYQRLAARSAPDVCLRHLAIIDVCDSRARNAQSSEPLDGSLENLHAFLLKAYEAGVVHGPVSPLLKGRDFLFLSLPGPKMGDLVRRAYHLQIEEGITDAQELKERVLKQAGIAVKN